MTTYEIHGDRSLLYDVSEVSFHLRMGKKRTENYLHYLWLEKIISPVRYRKIGSEPYWTKSSIDCLLKTSKEEWDGLKIPEFDPRKNYKSSILKFPISKNTNSKMAIKMKKDQPKKNDDMRPKKNIPQVAINCRIPEEVHQQMSGLLNITKKSAAAFISDAVVQYIALLPKEKDITKQLTNAMQIDRFAYNLSGKEK